MSTQAELFNEPLLDPGLPTTVDGCPLEPDPDVRRGTLVRDPDGILIGKVGPPRGNPPRHQVTDGEGRKLIPTSTVEDGARLLIRIVRARAERAAEVARLASLSTSEAAAAAWDHHAHAAATGLHDRTHRDGSPWALSREYTRRCQEWVARNPDRAGFIAAQEAGRQAALSHHAPGSDRADVLVEHARVGDQIWGAQEVQGARFDWREILTIEADPAGNGAHLTHTGRRSGGHIPLAPQRDMTVTLRVTGGDATVTGPGQTNSG